VVKKGPGLSDKDDKRCQEFFRKNDIYRQVNKTLKIIKQGFSFLLNINHVVLLEIFKRECSSSAVDKIEIIQIELATSLKLELEQVQANAKTILDLAVKDGMRKALRTLHENIDRSLKIIPGQMTRSTVVMGSQSTGSSLMGFFSNPIYDSELTRMVFDMMEVSAPRQPKRAV